MFSFIASGADVPNRLCPVLPVLVCDHGDQELFWMCPVAIPGDHWPDDVLDFPRKSAEEPDAAEDVL